MRISVVLDSLDPDALVEFWSAALGYRPVAGPGGYRVLAPAPADGGREGPGGGGPLLVLQRVPEPRQGKNRLHLDLHPADVPAHLARLESLGGRRVGEPVTELLGELGIWWQVMADPEGNELCIVADPGHPAPQ